MHACKFMTNAILEMVSILKGIAIKGDERISAIIEVFLDVSKATWPFWGLERELLKAAERERSFQLLSKKRQFSKPFQGSHD